MTVLAIDTATEILGVALARVRSPYVPAPDEPHVPHVPHVPDVPGEPFELIEERLCDGGLHHGRTAAAAVQSLLESHDLSAGEVDLLVVTGGPGSFTGLRIGISLAKGISAGAAAPIAAVPTLDRFSRHLRWAPQLVVPVIDARKKR
ncbi:MAG: tRNA (adenosine(37)-N6)-threonylcarbamoyltransferase complex dimerization subunit type 1 TsaB, partial [Spirochaetota bacterium]